MQHGSFFDSEAFIHMQPMVLFFDKAKTASSTCTTSHLIGANDEQFVAPHP